MLGRISECKPSSVHIIAEAPKLHKKLLSKDFACGMGCDMGEAAGGREISDVFPFSFFLCLFHAAGGGG